MQSVISRSPVAHSLEPAQPIFRLFAACEDQVSFNQARKIQEHVERLCDDELVSACMSWSFAMLCHDQLKEFALLEAATADMIVLSFRAHGEIPAAVQRWIERWPVRPTQGQGALVAMIGPEEPGVTEPHQQLPWLRNVAESRGLDFLSNQDGWKFTDFGRLSARRTSARPIPTPVPAYASDPFSFDTAWVSGGINE